MKQEINKFKTVVTPFAIAFGLFFAQACVQENESFETPKQQTAIKAEVTVIDGAVHFKDVQAFSNTMTLLHKGGIQKLEDFENSIGFQNSLRSTLVQEDGEEQVININIKDLYFASVVNQKGIYFIGNTIHKIDSEYEYALSDGNETLLSKALMLSNANAKKESVNGLVMHKITGIGISSNSSARFSGKAEHITYWAINNGEPKRVTMDAWSRNYLKYSSNGVNITTESYRKGGALGSKAWRDSKVDYLKVDGTTKCYPSVNGTGGWELISEQAEGYDTHHVQNVFEYVAGVLGGAWLDTDYIDCTYTYTRDDNNTTVSEHFHFTN